ncbi:MAG TPA: DNA translocase FtsK [Chitinophagales bacterium]|nr:DNA translocase FtsK [Chitinophagales bacterium]HRP40008.1 DNA translocase FtsK [Chitinophagales bacterium]
MVHSAIHHFSVVYIVFVPYKSNERIFVSLKQVKMQEVVFENSFKGKKKKEETAENTVEETVKEKPQKAKPTKQSEAKKSSKTMKDDFDTPVQEPNFFKDGRALKIVGLLLLLFSFFLGIALTSFLFTIEEDQSLVHGNSLETLTRNSIHAENALGRLGAVLANFFFNNLFGFSSFILVAIVFAAGFNLLLQKRVFNVLTMTVNGALLAVWGAATLAFANYLISPDSVLAWGGSVGNFLTGSYGWLTGLIGIPGVFATLFISALIVAVAIYNISFGSMLNWFKKKPQATLPISTNTGTVAHTADFPADYRDPSENIFAKDNLDEAVENGLDLEIEKEEIIVQKNKVVAPPKEADEEDLDLEIAETKPEEEEYEYEQKHTHTTPYDPTEDLSNYKMPTLTLLEEHGSEKINLDKEELERNKNQIVATLNNYQIEISKIKATVGPTVTLYEIIPAPGVRISKIKNLEDDIALSLAALGIRIIAPIPGKGTIGIEVPNLNKEVVSMRSLLASEKFQNTSADLPICLGKSISNEIYVADLAKMPHLLMAGATGQGKSVGINAIIVSLLYKKHPSQIKFVLVDPKKVELSLYEALERHFLAKLPGEEDAIITDTKKVVTTLNALCVEMDNRYELLKKASVRNLKEYNAKFISRKLNPQNGHKFLPYIVLVVDEFADLIMTAGKEVEMPIARLAQLARAIGIHLILATQRPSVNIITGTIKANFPARIAFKTTSKIDSRTILDQGGAEQLIGRGDMLLSVGSDMLRLQCGFVDTPEVELVRNYIAEQQAYPTAFELPEYIDPKGEKSADSDFFSDTERDELFEDAARIIVQNQMGSTSLIQRRMKLGYNRAGRLMDQLEEAGIVGENVGSKAREVKFKTEAELESYLLKLRE